MSHISKAAIVSIALLTGILVFRHTGGRDLPWKVVSDDQGQIRIAVCLSRTSSENTVCRRVQTRLPGHMLLLNGSPSLGSATVSQVRLPATAQDSFLVLERRRHEYMLLGSRDCDPRILRSLSERLKCRWRRSGLTFGLGDIVPGRDRVFIGPGAVHRNKTWFRRSERKTISKFERALGKPVTVLGAHPSPVGDLTRVFSAVDESNVVVADARMGERELQRGEQYPRGLKPSRDVHRTAAYLDEIAAKLRKQGYAVHRVPFLPSENKSARASISYNNVLIETIGDRRIVYLPQYGIQAVDEAAPSAWANAGFCAVTVRIPVTESLLKDQVRVLTRER